jgi:hypothetical protein
MWGRRLREEKRRTQVERKYLVPLFHGNRTERRTHHHGRRVDQDVERTESLGDPFDQPCWSIGRGEVRLKIARAAPARFDGLNRLLGPLVTLVVVHRDGRTSAGQGDCEGPAHPSPATGDQSHSATQIHNQSRHATPSRRDTCLLIVEPLNRNTHHAEGAGAVGRTMPVGATAPDEVELCCQRVETL